MLLTLLCTCSDCSSKEIKGLSTIYVINLIQVNNITYICNNFDINVNGYIFNPKANKKYKIIFKGT